MFSLSSDKRLNALYCTLQVLLFLGVNQKRGHLRLERGGEHVIWASCTKMVISRLINKISKHIIHQKIAYFQAF